MFEVINTTWENLQIAKHKSVLFNSLSLLNWFVLCDLQIFSGCVCRLEQLHAQAPFLFPIVFGINLIPFFDISSLSFVRVSSPFRGPLCGRISVTVCGFVTELCSISSSSPNPLSNESVIHDGRKHNVWGPGDGPLEMYFEKTRTRRRKRLKDSERYSPASGHSTKRYSDWREYLVLR